MNEAEARAALVQVLTARAWVKTKDQIDTVLTYLGCVFIDGVEMLKQRLMPILAAMQGDDDAD